MCGIKLRTFIFDFDGTLAVLNIDFTQLKKKVALVAERYSVHAEPNNSPLLEWLDEMADIIGNKEKAREFRKEALTLIKEAEIEAATKGKLFDFTEALLKFLKHNGYNVGIVTRNCEDAVKIVFPRILDYCHVFIPREKAIRIKPHPLHIYQVMDKLKASPETTMIIGDHPLDIAAGLNAGTFTGGVSSGKISANQLKNAGAHYVADNCISLFRMLNEVGLIDRFEL